MIAWIIQSDVVGCSWYRKESETRFIWLFCFYDGVLVGEAVLTAWKDSRRCWIEVGKS
jgi:hypothetical protein